MSATAIIMKKENRAGIRYVLVVQCARSRERCSGFACENWFHERKASFAGYPEGTRWLAITCGQVCGKGGAEATAPSENLLKTCLEHFKRKLLKKTDIGIGEVSVHLSSCMVTDNSHHARCPHVAEIRQEIEEAGFANITEGTYVSARAQARREQGVYRTYPGLEMA